MTNRFTAVSPTDWGARKNYDEWAPTTVTRDKIIIHHGGGPNPAGAPPYDAQREAAQLRRWEAYHIDGRGWRGIGYAYAVGQTGTLYRLRGDAYQAAHAGDLDRDGIAENGEAWAIVGILGTGQEPSANMTATIEATRVALEAHPYAGGPLRLYGHQEIAEIGAGGTRTACPGTLQAFVEANRDAAPPEPEQTLEDLVRHIQRALRRAGYRPIKVDGNAGFVTRARLTEAFKDARSARSIAGTIIDSLNYAATQLEQLEIPDTAD